jgi:hypothetical protein
MREFNVFFFSHLILYTGLVASRKEFRIAMPGFWPAVKAGLTKKHGPLRVKEGISDLLLCGQKCPDSLTVYFSGL